jgi:hypothetical protein
MDHTMRVFFAVTLIALLAVPVVQAGCCSDSCDQSYSSATTCVGKSITRDTAGCDNDETRGCLCTWEFEGEKSLANGCTEFASTWVCSSANDYETNGKCYDSTEKFNEDVGDALAGIGGVLIGIIAAAVIIPLVTIILCVWCCCFRNQHTTVIVAPTAQ